MNERKFDLGSGSLGNGISVWNRAKEVHGDYEKIAHIDRNRKVTYYIKNPPKEVIDYVNKIAKGKNPSMSTSQSHMKVFNEDLINKYLGEELGIGFWNRLIQKINRTYKSKIMLREDRKTGLHFVMMVNTFHEFPKDFLKVVKDNVKLGKDEIIDEKNRKIMLSDKNWQIVNDKI